MLVQDRISFQKEICNQQSIPWIDFAEKSYFHFCSNTDQLIVIDLAVFNKQSLRINIKAFMRIRKLERIKLTEEERSSSMETRTGESYIINFFAKRQTK